MRQRKKTRKEYGTVLQYCSITDHLCTVGIHLKARLPLFL